MLSKYQSLENIEMRNRPKTFKKCRQIENLRFVLFTNISESFQYFRKPVF